MRKITNDRRRFISKEMRFSVFERDGFRCVYCGKSAVDGLIISVSFHNDHAYPRALGGCDDWRKNLVTCCSDCNQGKKDRVLACTPPAFPREVAQYVEQMKQPCVSDAPAIAPFDRTVVEALVASHESARFACANVHADDLQDDICRDVFLVAQVINDGETFLNLDSIKNAVEAQLDAFDAYPAVCLLNDCYLSALRYWNHPNALSEFRTCCDYRKRHCAAQLITEQLKTQSLSTEREIELFDELVAMRRQVQSVVVQTEATDGTNP